jgi:hypothetical protein
MTIPDLPYAARLNLMCSMLPHLPGTCRPKRRLDVLLADEALPAESALLLGGSLHLLNTLLSETDGATDLLCVLHVPTTNSVATATLEDAGLAYAPVLAEGEYALDDVWATNDIDVALVHEAGDEQSKTVLLVSSIDDVRRVAEVFARGFGVAFSFTLPVHDQPWSNFSVSEWATMRPLITFAESLKAKSPAGQEALRVIIYNTIPNLCYARDMLAFYDMQRRAAERMHAERQDYAFEIGYHLNHFYLALYSGIDQVAIMVNGFLNLGIPEHKVGAVYTDFRNALNAASRVLFALFGDAQFKELMERVSLLRHQAAHRMPLRPTTIYQGEDFTDEQLDAKAAEMGETPDLSILPPELHASVVNLARHKALTALLSVVTDDVIVVDGKTGRSLVWPDPAGDFGKFIDFVRRVLTEVQSLP